MARVRKQTIHSAIRKPEEKIQPLGGGTEITMKIQLSDHFTLKRLVQFVLPSIVMMIFTSIYGVVDGLFVSNYVGKTPFAAINLIYPLLMMIGAVGFMLGAGGSAIVARTLGEGKKEQANRYFSLLIIATAAGGVLFSTLGELFVRPVSILLGADESMLPYCVLYGRILFGTMTAFMLQNVFQSFFVVAEKPKLGLAVTVAAGMTNMVFDYVFIVILKWGLAGAAAATAFSQVVGGISPFLFFLRKNDSLLRLSKTKWEIRVLLQACVNGSSELMTNISASIVTMAYNFQLLRLAGEDGVAAYGVIMYANFIFAAIFFGFAIGSAPVISYHYGAGNETELKNLFRKSMLFIGGTCVGLTVLAQLLASSLTGLFVGYDAALFALTCRGFRINCISFLCSGFNIFGSAFFTALGNGAVSAAISFLRTLVFQMLAVMLLPIWFGADGIWAAIAAAELLALGVTVMFLVKEKKRYRYI